MSVILKTSQMHYLIAIRVSYQDLAFILYHGFIIRDMYDSLKVVLVVVIISSSTTTTTTTATDYHYHYYQASISG